MDSDLFEWLATLPPGVWSSRPPCPIDEIEQLERRFEITLPADYRGLLARSNGGSLIGPRERITLDPVAEVDLMNQDEYYLEALPGMFLVGDNTGGALYFYDLNNHLGRGGGSLFWGNMGDLFLETARHAGRDLAEVMHRIVNGVSFFDEPSIGPLAGG